VSLLEVVDLDCHYGAIHALQKVSLTVEKGEIVTLIGANGAGKSTTLRALSGLLKPTGGTIRLDGHSLVGLRPDQIVRVGVAHAPEGRGIFGSLTVLENLELGAYIHSDRAGIHADLDRMMKRFPILAERARQSAGTLSGGEQQMLAVARALMARPRLLLLDEPSLGLAPQIVQRIFSIIREINKEGVTILLVEQNAHQALAIAHRGYVLETGQVKMTDTAKNLAASDEVRKAYLGIG
jgi:branched-chain amino acid transport system ATP-binding protein